MWFIKGDIFSGSLVMKYFESEINRNFMNVNDCFEGIVMDIIY